MTPPTSYGSRLRRNFPNYVAATTIRDWWPDLSEDEEATLYRVFRLSVDKIRPHHVVVMLYLCVYDEHLRLRLNPHGHFIGLKFIRNQVLDQKPGSGHTNPLKHRLANYMPKMTGNKSEARAQSLQADLRAATKLLIHCSRPTTTGMKEIA